MIENAYWTGHWTGHLSTPPDELWDFLHQHHDPIFWLEQPLMGGPAVLVVTYELSTEQPLRVEPGRWFHFDGARFGPGRRAGGKDL